MLGAGDSRTVFIAFTRRLIRDWLAIMTMGNIEISIKGKWFSVPALCFGDKHIVVTGNWLRVATVHNEEWLETELRDHEACIDLLKKQPPGGLRADIFSFAQKLPATQPRYAYHQEWDSVAVAEVKSFQDWWEGLPQVTRKNIRRAAKRGVFTEVRGLDEKLLQDIVTLNNDAPTRQGKAFTHYGKTIQQVMKDQSDFLDHSDYICSYSGTELIGITKLVYRGDVASILTFLPKTAQSDKRPANAMIAKAVELCEKRNISYLIYGMFNYGRKKDSPLREFKVRNGFQEVLLPRYFVPLTLWGNICIAVGLHRGIIGLLPHWTITLLVNARARWYSLQKSRCSSMVEQPNCNRQTERSNPPAGSNPLVQDAYSPTEPL